MCIHTLNIIKPSKHYVCWHSARVPHPSSVSPSLWILMHFYCSPFKAELRETDWKRSHFRAGETLNNYKGVFLSTAQPKAVARETGPTPWERSSLCPAAFPSLFCSLFASVRFIEFTFFPVLSQHSSFSIFSSLLGALEKCTL